MEQNIGMEKPKTKVKTPPTKRKSRAANLRFVFGRLAEFSMCFAKRINFELIKCSIYSKEQIALALQKKRECNARAQRIVEEFLDPVPVAKVDFFLSNVSQSFYSLKFTKSSRLLTIFFKILL